MTQRSSETYRAMRSLGGQFTPRLPVGYFFRVKVERAWSPMRCVKVQIRKERFPLPSKKVAECLRIIDRIDRKEHASASELVASMMRSAHESWLDSLSDAHGGLPLLRGDYP